jgi:hypothetical protein
MSGRLAHEIAGHSNQFADYYAEQLTKRFRNKVLNEIPGSLCKYPSHKFQVDCPSECAAKFVESILKLDDPKTHEAIQKSQTLKTIYLEILRDYEYEHKIEIVDN